MGEQVPTTSGASDLQDEGLYFDTIIVGAGISGINSAYRIQTEGPAGMKYVILESRASMGGTWDLFRYPGLRSDSDIFTFGFSWSPWDHHEAMATGEQIREYLRKSAKSAGIDQQICYRHSVESADWSSDDRCWHLSVRVPGEEQPVLYRSRFILLGTGYYDYETPMQTVIPGIEDFQGKVIHPQFWPKDYDYSDKEVVIIGSGATTVTILPAIADKVKRVTMLQRSPSYIFSLPSSGFLTTLLYAILPGTLAHFFSRLFWIAKSCFTTWLCRTYPNVAKRRIRLATIQQLPPTIKWDPHFKPRYNPWEQRFCACMNGDFYAALRSGKGDVVTDKIKMITKNSIELESGQALHPDVIVTATGLKLKFGGGIQFSQDGKPANLGEKFAWKAAMLQDVPNLIFLTGYETASWTLGADVSAQIFLRVLRELEKRNATVAVPRVAPGVEMEVRQQMRLSSTYITNAPGILPKAGSGQWSPKKNYISDSAGARWGDVTTDLEFI